MSLHLSSLPSLSEFFPPTPQVYTLLRTVFSLMPLGTVAQWIPAIARYQAMGKTSTDSKFNLPGRYAWAVAEAVGPLNLLFILYTLPAKLKPTPAASTSFIGTGLPAQSEIIGLLYVLHYINRAGITPLLLAPSMSPIHPLVFVFMALFQYISSSGIAGWAVYSSSDAEPTSLTSPLALLGLFIFCLGSAGNIAAENSLFSLRRAAAKRKARSEGKATITYDKVYVIPPPEGLFKYVLFPHYLLEWLEWTGYCILGAAYGLGAWNSPAMWFLVNEICTMLPRAVNGRKWYEKRFGKRAVGGRGGVLPTRWT